MLCMRCAKVTQESAVFCETCLRNMARRPVKPGVAIQLPVRTATPTKKAAPRRKQISAEEQLQRLRRCLRWVGAALTCAVIALAITVSFLVHTTQQQPEEPDIGKNYNTVHVEDNAGS